MDPVHGHFHHHSPTAESLRETASERIMAFVTKRVGTLACAIIFFAIAMISFPAAIKTGQPIIIVAWLAQTLLQLVLLSVILGGQAVTERANDAQTKHISLGIDTALDRVDEHTEGGITAAIDEIKRVGKSVAELHVKLDTPAVTPMTTTMKTTPAKPKRPKKR